MGAFMLALLLQNLCVTAAHCPIKEILEKEKKVCLVTFKSECFEVASTTCTLMV